MSDPGDNPATRRVREKVGVDVLRALEEDLSPSDLRTLLLSVAATRAARIEPTRLLSASTGDRFTRPSDGDPRVLAGLEHLIWQLLPRHFEGLELSPVAPFGICAAVAGVHQSRIVTTVRGSEVVSDATNVLALEAARRRRGTPGGAVHLAASHRVLRGQAFGDPSYSSHFRLVNLVSSARDRGSGHTQADLFLAQLRAWATVLDRVLPRDVVWYVDTTVFRPGATAERLQDTVLPALQSEGLRFRELKERTGGDYYRDVAFKLVVETPDGEVEVGDGGLTDWTARLLGDAKERCVISCVSTERLATLTSA